MAATVWPSASVWALPAWARRAIIRSAAARAASVRPERTSELTSSMLKTPWSDGPASATATSTWRWAAVGNPSANSADARSHVAGTDQ
jgi:hypothetical protein